MKVYNSAAWLLSEKAHPFSILPAPFPDTNSSYSSSSSASPFNPDPDLDPELQSFISQLEPNDLDNDNDDDNNSLIIRTRAVAINPVDWKIQTYGNDIFPVPYPAILGSDLAGEVVHVGSSSASSTASSSLQHDQNQNQEQKQGQSRKFKAGDRVIVHALGLSHGWSSSSFQKYVLVKASNPAISLLPDDIAFEKGVVLPVSISTATAGLFWKGTLGLRLPSAHHENENENKDRTDRKAKEKETLLLWGGSSSVGSSVIQLATAAGYQVVATASGANFEYVKGLGAAAVVDYHDEDVVEQLVSLLKGEEVVVVGAYDSIGTETTIRQTAEVLRALGGNGNLRIASVGAAPGDLGEGIEAVRFSAGGIDVTEKEIGRAVWGEFVPRALGDGRLKTAPEPLVVGKGLERIQGALDLQKGGVSARKVVVSL